MKSKTDDQASVDQAQTMQRVRVGMTGLASVLLLIALASAVFSSASDEPPVTAIGASKPEVVANMAEMAIDNSIQNEPLAELGVAPAAPAAPATASENIVSDARK